MNHTFRKSYSNINDLIDEIFPPYSESGSGGTARKASVSEQFSDVNFWRMPVPVIDSSDEEG